MHLGRASARTCPQTLAFALFLAIAGCAGAPPAAGFSRPPPPPQLDLLKDRALTWHPGPFGSSYRGLRLLYDIGATSRLNLAVVRSIVRSNHRLEPFDALVMATQAVALSRAHRLDAAFFCATLLEESGFAPDALSPAGAIGIAQFTLGTADAEGVDPFDWRDAMRGSAELLGGYVRAYDGTYPDPYAAALAAYNAGPGTVAHYGGVPPFPETHTYIDDIYDRWSRILRDATGARTSVTKHRPAMLELVDAYEFLERADDPRTILWSAEQNARSRAYFDGLPQRAGLAQRFETLLQIETLGVPVERGGRIFFLRRRSAEAQFVLALREGSSERVLLDPLRLDESGLTALDWWYPSPHGRLVALGLSRSGDERSVLHVLDVGSGTFVGAGIAHARHSSVAWLPDESGFYYTRYPAGADYDARVYFHESGRAPEDDALVFGEGRAREDQLDVALSPNGRWLVATAFAGWRRADVYLCDRRAGHVFVPLVEDRDALYYATPADDRIVIRTNDEAPRYRVLEARYDAPARAAWREIVPERGDVLDGLGVARGALVAHYLHDVRSRLVARFDDGTETELGSGGCIVDLSTDTEAGEAYVLRTDFLEPPVVERIVLDAGRARSDVWARVAVPFDASRYAVKQEWFVSKDGTRIPMFVLSRAGLVRDGSAPAVLYGYGGFNVSMLPTFTPGAIPWLDAGGVFAVANLRGGGEFGEEWHRAGTLERKQNVFDDFIAAAEYLGSSGIADPRRIGIFGGSNGGLLTAACMTQRPDLFAAVGCAVPLTDMLRYHRFSIARLWIAEFGDPDAAGDAEVLRAYSPYHNVRDGAPYPATYLFAAESDSRVDPMHARKFGARLQAASTGGAPILVFIESDAGHGLGKPRGKQVAELADRWAFFFEALGVRGRG